MISHEISVIRIFLFSLIVFSILFSGKTLFSAESNAETWEGDSPFDFTITEEYAEKVKEASRITISEINQRKLAFGTYEVIGYVIDLYSCPPCPKNGLCVPCAPDHIVVSQRKHSYGFDALTEEELIIFVSDAKEFAKKRKYKFLIKILDVKTTAQFINNVKLIHHEQI